MIRLFRDPLREASSITQPTTTNNILYFFFSDPAVRHRLLPLSHFGSLDNSFGGSPSSPSAPRVSMGDRETVFVRACYMLDKEEVKRERYVAPARCHHHHHRHHREGKNDPTIPFRMAERAPNEPDRIGGRDAPMLPLRGFKNTKPALFAGPPTRAGALSLTVRRIRSRGSGTRTRRRLLSHPVLFSLSLAPVSFLVRHSFLVLTVLFLSQTCLRSLTTCDHM